MTDTKLQSINVNGVEIKLNNVYEVKSKGDNNSTYGTAKFPSYRIIDTASMPRTTSKASGRSGRWDTGFYEFSPRYSRMNKEKAQKEREFLVENIKNPIERIYGEGHLDHQKNETFDNLLVQLYEGRMFNTSKPEDLFELYVACLDLKLAPADNQGNSKYNNAQFTVENTTDKREAKKTQATLKSQALFNYTELSDRPTKVYIANYAGCPMDINEKDDAALLASYFQWLDQHRDNPNRFIKAYEFYDDSK